MVVFKESNFAIEYAFSGVEFVLKIEMAISKKLISCKVTPKFVSFCYFDNRQG
jgi:hypothetical protein